MFEAKTPPEDPVILESEFRSAPHTQQVGGRALARALRLAAIALLLCAFSLPALAAGVASQPDVPAHDGGHDFDFNLGKWKVHVSRLSKPLTGSTTWTEYDGTAVVRKVWDGGANLLELEMDGPTGHIESLGLRLYNPEARQWSLNWSSSRQGTLQFPSIGEFKNGRGEFIDQEPFNGRAILVRGLFSDIKPDSSHFEQAFSDDGGKTWETNWIMSFTRIKESVDAR